ncbi:MAG TPA: hypothetical protein PLR83_08645 [Pyrinomonadaceae bacterium]|nr:hypothetical protein [Pyrinomonadaceae bacterium]
MVAEVEEMALGLPASERGKLAEKLIRSLPGPFIGDDDDGVEEAIRRSREMDENPEMSLTEEEFMAGFENYQR